MAAVLSACPLEFMAEGSSTCELRECFDAPPQPPLRRATTEPPPDSGLASPWLLEPMAIRESIEAPRQSPGTPPPPPIDGTSAWAAGLEVKNTFLSIEAPMQPPLLRSRTDPPRAHDLEADADPVYVFGPPAPPPLGLEFIATEDNFERMPMAGEGYDEFSGPPGLPAPPPLSLEYIPTPDYWRTPASTEKHGLLTPPAAPPMLSLEFVATDDPFHATPTAGYSLGPFMDGPLHPMPQSLHSSGPPGLPLAAPPPLTLESFETEDPFENPLPFVSMSTSESPFVPMTTSEPAFVTLPQRPVMCGPPPPPFLPAPLIGTTSMPPPPPPPEMPSQPAPEFDAPSSHDVPMTQPGHMPGAGITALLPTELRLPGLLARPMTAAGCTHVHWVVDSRKLESQDKQTVSPVFRVELPGHGPTPFKLVLYPKATNDGKHGAGFKKAKGHGRVVLKCEAQLPENQSDVCFRIGLGRAGKGSETLQPFRGPVMENFFDHSCHGLAKPEEDWDFSKSVEDSRTFLVTLEVAPTAAFKADPSIWWASLPDAPPAVPATPGAEPAAEVTP